MDRSALFTLAAILALATAQPSVAMDKKKQTQLMSRELMELTPEARAEERCDARANGIVGREHKGFAPDKTVAYAFSDVSVKGTTVVARGAAIRSRGAWYRLSYSCRTTADGLGIEAFDYTLGAKIPKSDWDAHQLYP
jgi:hypothetical protein